MSEKLKELKEKVEEVVVDLATLEVASFTGSQITLNTEGDENQKHKKVFNSIRESLLTSTLVAYSRFEIEGDAMNYTNSDLGEEKKYLLDAHNSMVEGAQKSRKDFFEFVHKVIRG